MNYKLVKISELSGNKASVYSLYSEEEKCTLFEMFLRENEKSFKSEIFDILKRLNTIGKKKEPGNISLKPKKESQVIWYVHYTICLIAISDYIVYGWEVH
jgi:hypothetical protein